LAGVQAPGLTLAGATIPGLPFHVIGHNGRIAWGMTATHADTIDLFVERTIGDDAYQAPKGPQAFQRRQEVIKVKGGADVTLTVRETRHGPVISDVLPRAALPGGEVIAFSAAFLAADDLTAQAFFRLNRAGDWKGFVAALKDFHSPVQNLAYADATGAIGFYTAGRVPIRRSGLGAVPAPGWTGEADWTGWVPFAKMPQLLNPRSGRIVNANNKVVGDDYPYLLAADWPDGYRAARIGELLKDRKDLTVEDMALMQTDAVSREALELKELLTGVEPQTDRQRRAMAMITAWDGTAAADRPEPLLFAAWTSHLNRAIFSDELREAFPLMEPVRASVLIGALTRSRHWCDDVSTPEAEGCDDMVLRSLDAALAELSKAWGDDMAKWRWGQAHQATFDSPVLGKVPGLARIANLSVPAPGDDFTVSRGSWLADGQGHFPNPHGPGLRAVFDLADLSHSRFILATGQSGNPLSRHYGDMMKDWAANRGVTIVPHGGIALMTMEPVK
ncbi:MAG: penicillin acylase family protein, partial [Actinomycetota bacterium]